MKCPSCGKEIDSYAKYCPNCRCDIEDENSISIIRIIFFSTLGILLLVFGVYASITDGRANDILFGSLYLIIFIVVGILLLSIIIFFMKHIKNIVVNVGRFILDLNTSVNVIASLVIIIVGFIQCSSEYGISSFIWLYILGALGFLLISLLADYTLYLLVDIRDLLKTLVDSKTNNKN